MYDRPMLDRLFRYCYTLCDQESDAFDLLQIGVERALSNPPSNPKATYNYTIRIIRNAFIDNLRRKHKHPLEEYDETIHLIDWDVENLEKLLIDRSELAHIWEALKPIEREILFLWAVEGNSITQVSDHLDKPRNSILSIIHRMRKRLIAEQYITQDKGEVA